MKFFYLWGNHASLLLQCTDYCTFLQFLAHCASKGHATYQPIWVVNWFVILVVIIPIYICSTYRSSLRTHSVYWKSLKYLITLVGNSLKSAQQKRFRILHCTNLPLIKNYSIVKIQKKNLNPFSKNKIISNASNLT